MPLFQSMIYREIRKALRPTVMEKLAVTSRTFPRFRFPDFQRAVAAYVKERTELAVIRSAHYTSLDQIVRPQMENYGRRGYRINPSLTQLVAVDYRKEESFPSDCFWCFRDSNSGLAGVIRIRFDAHRDATVEVGVSQGGQEGATLEELCRLSVEHSVYRNKLLQVDFAAEIRDEYGEAASARELQVTFRADPGVRRDDIVLDPSIEPVLERNVVRFHEMRDQLRELGLPLQRGILLHGPPGTGKTYTCQYLYHRLQPVTMIVVAGKGLTEVKSICNLARTLNPSVVLLEDVDLIFASREINLYSTGLGEMMDELDGFQQDEAVTFILTTNAIDRLEEAIKDRPGRISQCVYFGLPGQELRARYLDRFLRRYDTNGLSIDRVAEISEGGSQAFLQELVNRAVQIAAEEISEACPQLRLATTHFEEAVREMTQFTEKATESIIGFRGRSGSSHPQSGFQ